MSEAEKKKGAAALRKQIEAAVTALFPLDHGRAPFVPGRSKIHYAGRVFDEKEIISLVNAALDFWLTAGRETAAFEKKFGDFIGLPCCVLVNSGSSANLLAVASLLSHTMGRKIQPGDEVITPALTFPTALNPLIQNGLRPVLVDVERDTLNMDPSALAGALSEKTRLVFLPHILGNMAPLDDILAFARDHGLILIEDACEALGSRYRGRLAGTFGHVGTFSFYASHHLSMGEGGAVVTSDGDLETVMRSLRDWGRACTCKICSAEEDVRSNCPIHQAGPSEDFPQDYDRRFTYTNIGYNLRATDLQAAIGLVQLDKAERFRAMRAENFNFFRRLILNYPDYFVPPRASDGADPSWFAFPLILRRGAPIDRRRLVRWLNERGIETRPILAGNIARQPAYQNIPFRIPGPLNQTDDLMDHAFFFGVYPGLLAEERDYVASSIEDFIRRAGD
jgi:CDP-6-deoxy-D-xylo-4-hexulose-3-dehydrase